MKEVNLNTSEWNVMESLWKSAPKIGSEIVNDLKKSVGWSRSTTLTILRRMTEKKLLECVDAGGIKAYSPLVKREDAVKNETDNFLNRVYNGSISMMMSAFVNKQNLSKQEIEELYGILKEAEEKQHG